MIFDLLRKDDHSRILTSEQLAEYLSAGQETSSGESVTPDRAMRVATVFACVRVLAESIGQLPLHLMRQDGTTKEKAYNLKLYGLLHDAPNEWQTSLEFWEMCVTHLAMRGNFYAYKNVVRGELRELLPFPAGVVTPEQRGDYSIVYRVNWLDGTTDTLAAEEMFHVPLFTVGGVLGLSPVAYARETIGLAMATEKHGARLFKNGAQPGGVLETDQVWKKETVQRFRETWNATHGGTSNANKLAILHSGLKYKQTGLTSEDAQFLESRQYGRTEICGIFRVPPHFVGDLSRATFSNIENQDLGLVKHSLMPYARRIEQRISLSLLNLEQRKTLYARFNLDGLLRGDAKSRSESLAIKKDRGIISANEWRELDEMNPREGGDTYTTPVNMRVEDPNTPKTEENKPNTDTGVVAGGEKVQDAALNGAQTESLRALIEAVASGALPEETARAMIAAAFPAIDSALIDQMFAGLEGFTLPADPAAPPPADPEQSAEKEDDQ